MCAPPGARLPRLPRDNVRDHVRVVLRVVLRDNVRASRSSCLRPTSRLFLFLRLRYFSPFSFLSLQFSHFIISSPYPFLFSYFYGTFLCFSMVFYTDSKNSENSAKTNHIGRQEGDSIEQKSVPSKDLFSEPVKPPVKAVTKPAKNEKTCEFRIAKIRADPCRNVRLNYF